MPLPRSKRQVACRQAASLQTLTSYHSMASCNDACADSSESDEARRRSTPPRRHRPARRGERPEAPAAGTAWWRKCGPAAQRRANGVAYSADNRASGLLRRLPEVLPRGLRRLWDGAPCPITLAQFPARQHLAGKIRFPHPALYYNYPLSQGGCTFWEHDCTSVCVLSHGTHTERGVSRAAADGLALGPRAQLA